MATPALAISLGIRRLATDRPARPRLSSLAVSLLAALVLPSHAVAQDTLPERLLVSIEHCAEAPIETASVMQLLRVEMTSDGIDELHLVEANDPLLLDTAPGVAIVHLSAAPCAEGRAVIAVRIDDLVTRKRVERIVGLDTIEPGARPRALALAVAELLRASWAELAQGPSEIAPAALVEAATRRITVWPASHMLGSPVQVEADPQPALAPDLDPEPSREAQLSIAGAFVVRAFPSAASAQVGGRLSLDVALARELALRVDGELVTGTTLHALGTIELSHGTLGVSVLYAVVLGRETLLTLGPRIAGGVAWTRGRAYSPMTRSGEGLGPLVTLGGTLELDVRLAGGLSLRMGAEVGAAAVGLEARVETVPVTGLEGALLAGWVGLAYGLGGAPNDSTPEVRRSGSERLEIRQ